MAEHLASIFGTEKDRVNCPFYFKIGACRHGDRCSRLHNKPSISPTLLLCNMYPRPDMITPGVDAQGNPIDPERIQEDFEDFYEDIFEELSKHGEVESLHVCDNLADHMIGNVYVQFREEEQATRALRALQGRYYSGRPIIAEFSPVTDFREATCRKADREGPAAEAVRAPAPPLPPEPQPEQPQPEPVPPPPELVPLQGPRRRPRVLLPLPQRQWQPPEQREAPQPRQRREPPPARAVEEPEQEPGEGRQRGAEGKDRAMEPRTGGRAGVSRCSGCAGISQDSGLLMTWCWLRQVC